MQKKSKIENLSFNLCQFTLELEWQEEKFTELQSSSSKINTLNMVIHITLYYVCVYTSKVWNIYLKCMPIVWKWLFTIFVYVLKKSLMHIKPAFIWSKILKKNVILWNIITIQNFLFKYTFKYKWFIMQIWIFISHYSSLHCVTWSLRNHSLADLSRVLKLLNIQRSTLKLCQFAELLPIKL